MKWVKRLLLFGVGAAVLAVGGLILVVSLPVEEAAVLPSPNGYDLLVEAAEQLPKDVRDIDGLTEAELMELVQNRTTGLEAARGAFDVDGRVPIDSQDFGLSRTEALKGTRELARAFQAEGRLAEAQERYGDAALAYIDAIRVGFVAGQGGLIIDRLVAVACQAQGLNSLEKILDQMPAEPCRIVLGRLIRIDRESETFDQVLNAERDWVRKSFPLGMRISAFFMRLMPNSPLRQTETRFTQKVTVHTDRFRQMIVSVAARAYELERGEKAQSVADLVPEFIPEPPMLATSGEPVPWITIEVMTTE